MMNIEQNSNMQELKPEEYTKVYGAGNGQLMKEDVLYGILPVGPIKPKKPSFSSHQQPLHTGIFGG